MLIAACIYAGCQGNELFGHNGHSSLDVTELCLSEVLAGAGSLEEKYDDIITYVAHSRVTEHPTLVCKFWTCRPEQLSSLFQITVWSGKGWTHWGFCLET